VSGIGSIEDFSEKVPIQPDKSLFVARHRCDLQNPMARHNLSQRREARMQ
jgi:hypothetical protein